MHQAQETEMIEKRTDFEQKQGAYRQAQKALNQLTKQ
jgi:hypothetical protein